MTSKCEEQNPPSVSPPTPPPSQDNNDLPTLKATLIPQKNQDEEAVKAKLRKWYKHRLHFLTATFVAGGVVTVATCGLGAPLWVAALAFGSAAGTGLGVEKVKEDYGL